MESQDLAGTDADGVAMIAARPQSVTAGMTDPVAAGAGFAQQLAHRPERRGRAEPGSTQMQDAGAASAGRGRAHRRIGGDAAAVLPGAAQAHGGCGQPSHVWIATSPDVGELGTIHSRELTVGENTASSSLGWSIRDTRSDGR
jgi:hypothetical protein